MDHQVRCLTDAHEVARHLRMRDRHRAALFNLPLESGDNAATAAQHIAEAHGGVTRLMVIRLGQRQDQQFADTFAGPHHAGRVHRLIRRNENKTLHALIARQQSQIARTTHVHPQRLAGIILHHRHMLISSRMEDDLRHFPFKELLQAWQISDIRQHWLNFHIRVAMLQFNAQVVQIAFVIIQQVNTTRRILSQT